MLNLPHDAAQGIARDEKSSKIGKDSKNSAPYDPRGIIEEGRLRDVQCRSTYLKQLKLERAVSEQGKYEEEKKSKRVWGEGGRSYIDF